MGFKSIGRRIDNLLDRGPEKRIMYSHIPKCGGSSVATSIRNIYGFWSGLRGQKLYRIDTTASAKAASFSDKSLFEFRKELLVYQFEKSRLQFITGHVGVDEAIMNKFCDNWNFVTVLRDPVERWYSEYYYNRYKDSDHFQTDLPIEDYISNVGKRRGHKYVTFFSEKEKNFEERIREAKEVLSNFDLVGFLDNLPRFKKKFKNLFKRKLTIPHKNKSPKPYFERKEIPNHIHEKVVELCQPDIEIYNYIKSTTDSN